MLNLDKIGVPFAKIIGGKYNNEIVSDSEDLTADKSFKYLGIQMARNASSFPTKRPKEKSYTLLDHLAVAKVLS